MDKLRQCIGGQQDDSDHPIMEAQLAAQKGNTSTGEGEVREGRAKPARGWGCRLLLLPTSHIDGVQSRTCGESMHLSSVETASSIGLQICSCCVQVFILPTIRINGVQYRGKMATAEVLRAICAGFSTGNMPQACSKVGQCGQAPLILVLRAMCSGSFTGIMHGGLAGSLPAGLPPLSLHVHAALPANVGLACRKQTEQALPSVCIAGNGRCLHAGRQGISGLCLPHRRQDAGKPAAAS